MRPISRILYALIIISVILAVLVRPRLTALAQQDEGESAWGEFLNPDGSINWANLTYLGEVEEPVDWMYIEVPGGVQIPLGDARYNRYVTPSGNVLVLPAPATMFMTFLHPDESGFNANPPEMLGTGHQALAALTAGYIDLQDLQELGYVDPMDFFQAVIEGRENIWSLISPEFLIELTRMTLEAGYLVTGLWLYLHGVSCEAIPGGCPPGLETTPTPGEDETPPLTGECPAPSVAFGQIAAFGEKVAPPNPVVIGQDPEKRGVDVELGLNIPPVVFTWYEAQETEICRYSQDGGGDGCPAPGDQYDEVIDADGWQTAWSPSMQNSARWEAYTEIECIEHVEVFPDYLNYASLRVSLSPESRGWILTDLAQAYPGASLKHPDWQFTFAGPGSANGDSLVTWSQLIPSVQLADPGLYHLQVSGRTTGTPVSEGRYFTLALKDFTVDLLRVTLIEAP